LVFLTEFVKQHGHFVVLTHVPQNKQLSHWAKYLRRESHKLFTAGTSKVKFEKATELAELRFYKKKNGFEGAPGVLDFYNNTFTNIRCGNGGHPPSHLCVLGRWILLLWQRLLIPRYKIKLHYYCETK
jgi:hypothetical protein